MFDAVVAFAAEIGKPALAEGIELEGSLIHMAMGCGGGAAFDAEVDGHGVVPRGACDGNGDRPLRVPDERGRLGGRGELVGVEDPEEGVGAEPAIVASRIDGGACGAPVFEEGAFAALDVGGIAKVSCEPPRDAEGVARAAAMDACAAAIGVFEGETGGTIEEVAIEAALLESGGCGESEVGVASGLEDGEAEDIVSGAIVPVGGAFGIVSAGGIGFHGEGEGLDAGVEVFAAGVGGEFGDGDGAGDHARIADLTPIVASAVPPRIVGGGKQAFVKDGIGDEVAVDLREFMIEPIVAGGDGKGHFADIQKMAWVPVLEGGDGAQLRDAAVEIGAVGSHAVGESEG